VVTPDGARFTSAATGPPRERGTRRATGRRDHQRWDESGWSRISQDGRGSRLAFGKPFAGQRYGHDRWWVKCVPRSTTGPVSHGTVPTSRRRSQRGVDRDPHLKTITRMGAVAAHKTPRALDLSAGCKAALLTTLAASNAVQVWKRRQTSRGQIPSEPAHSTVQRPTDAGVAVSRSRRARHPRRGERDGRRTVTVGSCLTGSPPPPTPHGVRRQRGLQQVRS